MKKQSFIQDGIGLNVLIYLILLFAALVICFPQKAASAQVDPDTPPDALPVSGGSNWTLVWSDEFDGGSLDTSKWQKLVSTKSRAPRPDKGIDDWWWVAANAFLDGGGNLILRATKVDYNTMHCGSIYTNNLYEPTYGYFEARIKVADTSKAVHTAFWFQGDNMSNVDGTGNDGAEIDVFESAWVGDYTKSVVHIDGYGADHQANTKQWDAPGIHDGYHTYGFDWTYDYLKIYYDGQFKTQYTDSKWIPRVPEYLWLSDGASFGDGDFQSQPVGTLTEAEVDYVRVWQFVENGLPNLVDDTDGSITYSSGWGTWTGNPGYEGTEHYSETTGAVATFNFTGTKAQYYGFKRGDLGHAEIFLDGDLVDTIDCYNSTGLYFVMLYETPDLIYDEHTLSVRVKGTKNAASSGTEIIVDAFAFSQTHTADLNLDNNVDNKDVAELSRGWHDPYNFDSLLILADDWLYYHTPEAYWKLDDNASDSCNNGYDGTVFGSPVWDPNGHIDGALRFNGFDDYVKITGWKGIAGANPRTVCAWIKTLNIGIGEIVSWGEDEPGRRWSFYVNQSGVIRLAVNDGHIQGTTFLPDGQWHHVAAVLPEGASDANEIELYVDGEIETQTTSSSRLIDTANYYKVKIGAYNDPDRYFNGLIDDVRIYEFALEEAKIEQLAGMGD